MYYQIFWKWEKIIVWYYLNENGLIHLNVMYDLFFAETFENAWQWLPVWVRLWRRGRKRTTNSKIQRQFGLGGTLMGAWKQFEIKVLKNCFICVIIYIYIYTYKCRTCKKIGGPVNYKYYWSWCPVFEKSSLNLWVWQVQTTKRETNKTTDYFGDTSLAKAIFRKYLKETCFSLQLLFKYLVDLCFTPKLFSKVWQVQKTLFGSCRSVQIKIKPKKHKKKRLTVLVISLYRRQYQENIWRRIVH